MYKALVLLILASAFSAFGQVRYIPHVTDVNSDFQTWVILENTGAELASYELNIFTSTGSPQPFVLGSIAPGEIQIWEHADILGSEHASHFTIGSESHPATNIKFSIAYGLKNGEGSRAYIHESSTAAFSWRLFAGNWANVYDAISVVNLGEHPSTIKVRQRALDGSTIKEVVIADNVLPLSKTLYIIGGAGSVFDGSLSPVFEIEADQPVGVIALQGDLPGSRYLWQNPTIAQR